jgi:hypothetical protein
VEDTRARPMSIRARQRSTGDARTLMVREIISIRMNERTVYSRSERCDRSMPMYLRAVMMLSRGEVSAQVRGCEEETWGGRNSERTSG